MLIGVFCTKVGRIQQKAPVRRQNRFKNAISRYLIYYGVKSGLFPVIYVVLREIEKTENAYSSGRAEPLLAKEAALIVQ